MLEEGYGDEGMIRMRKGQDMRCKMLDNVDERPRCNLFALFKETCFSYLTNPFIQIPFIEANLRPPTDHPNGKAVQAPPSNVACRDEMLDVSKEMREGEGERQDRRESSSIVVVQSLRKHHETMVESHKWCRDGRVFSGRGVGYLVLAFVWANQRTPLLLVRSSTDRSWPRETKFILDGLIAAAETAWQLLLRRTPNMLERKKS